MKYALTFLWIAMVAAVHGIASEPCSEPDLAIEDVRLFDGEAVVERATVITSCTRITAVVRGDEAIELSEGTVIISGEGRTLLPGLIDTHTHTWTVPMLERPLDFGVTTVMGMGSTNPTFAATMRTEREQGPARDRADLFAAGLWVTAPGSHGTQWAEVPTLVEPGDATAFVAQRITDGADHIKLIYDNFKMFDQEIPTLREETMEAVVKAAHEQGVMAVVHSRDVEAWEDVVNAGVDGIVHLPVDEVPSDELIQLMRDKNIWVSGNLSLTQPLGEALIDDPSFGPVLTEPEKENLQRYRANHREGGDQVALNTAKALHANGVTFLPGSDTPNGGTTEGATLHRDLEKMVEIGFSPVEALQAATSKAVEAFRLTDRGHIAEGLQADLLLVEGAPDQNILDTRKIVAIIKAGKLHRKDAGVD